MSNRTGLILQYDGLARNIRDTFHEIASSEIIRETMLRDPIGTLTKRLLPGLAELDQQQVDAGNRLLFALLSNKKFAAWAEKYEQLAGKLPAGKRHSDVELGRQYLLGLDTDAGYTEFVKGLQESLDIETLFTILSPYSSQRFSRLDLAQALSTTRPPAAAKAVSALPLVALEVLAVHQTVIVVHVTLIWVHTRVQGGDLTQAEAARSIRLAPIAEQLASDLVARADQFRAGGSLVS